MTYSICHSSGFEIYKTEKAHFKILRREKTMRFPTYFFLVVFSDSLRSEHEQKIYNQHHRPVLDYRFKEQKKFAQAVRSTLEDCLEQDIETDLECYRYLFNSDYFWW